MMNQNRLLRRLWRDTAAISLVEFGLMMPIFLGTIVAGIDMTQFTIATQRMQRVAANMGDLVAQSGTAGIGASEGQINDLFLAMDVAAKPFKLRQQGRIIITGVQGQRNASNAIENRKLWHRCDGLLTGKPNKLPGAVGGIVNLPQNRQMADGEILIHSQLIYKFEPLMKFSVGDLFTDKENTFIERTAFFRPRSKTFTSITPDGQPAKSNCQT